MALDTPRKVLKTILGVLQGNLGKAAMIQLFQSISLLTCSLDSMLPSVCLYSSNLLDFFDEEFILVWQAAKYKVNRKTTLRNYLTRYFFLLYSIFFPHLQQVKHRFVVQEACSVCFEVSLAEYSGLDS
mmetsp:Transcript_36545/g.48189  ORF Transcript_36545/g.48189 Transcript_36545/m.48189 type:complete len:128 (-) Transcript_36545:82-465(-)